MLRITTITAAILCAAAGPIATPSAFAAYPGQNGKIAARNHGEIVLVDPAIGDADPIGGSSIPLQLGWSPDGSLIAYRSQPSGGDLTQPGDIRVIHADGTGDVALAPDPADDGHPSWSPDGSRIVFDSTRDGGFEVRELYTMNADGTNVQRLTNLEELEGQAHSPAWSPDGTKIAYIGRISTLPWRIRVMNADGTGDHAVTPENFQIVGRLDWAPNASRVVVEGGFGGQHAQFWTVEPDGENLAPLPNTQDDFSGSPFVEYNSPRFSPDGRRIVFASHEFIPNGPGPMRLLSQRLDGTDRRTEAEPTDENDSYDGPDWQPIPVNSYPRPAGATPMRVALVVGFQECTTPNRLHGPPLDAPSCANPGNSPPQSSSNVTVGTPDANGAATRFAGFVRMGVAVGNPATQADESDVRLNVSATDVRCRVSSAPVCGPANHSGPQDYAGALQASVSLRITDRDNSPHPGGPGPATAVDFPYSFAIACASTPDAGIGSSCGVETTADSLVPGTIKEGDRAIWELGQVEVLDGGPDGDVGTPAGAMVFLRQGIFIP